LGNKRISVAAVAQGGSQFDQFSGVSGTERQVRLHAIGPAQKLA
jgi:hypothetical protein